MISNVPRETSARVLLAATKFLPSEKALRLHNGQTVMRRLRNAQRSPLRALLNVLGGNGSRAK